MIRLAVRVAAEQAELVLAELLELAPAGVEEVQCQAGAAAGGIVEYAIYGAAGELPALPDLRAAAGGALVEVRTSEIADDWHERWRQFHRAVLIEAPRVSERPSAALDTVPAGERLSAAPDTVPALLVRPPWEAAAALPHEGVREIVIDPGQAFGTGAHASTRLCLELLLELAAGQAARGALLDVGTGSGVLAIAAAGLSFAPVLALDHDSVSVDAARANAAVNGAAIEVARYDLRTQTLPWPAPSELDASMPSPAPVVLANLLRPLLLELAAKLPDAPTHLIAGGLLAGEVDEVVGAFTARFELHERRRRRSGEWAAVWLSPA